jgi:2-polyprenyl-3-methyl-5-hydroxy-6-metoxy-1,4-benzoquinol methylase
MIISMTQAASNPRSSVYALLHVIKASAEEALAQYDAAGVPIPSVTTVSPNLTGNYLANNVGLKKAVRTLEGACEQLCSTLAPPAHTILNRVIPMEAFGLGIMAEHKVADALVKHPEGLHVSELSKAVGIESNRLARTLRMLATKHCFIEVAENVFANNRLSHMLVSTSTEASIVGVYTEHCLRAATFLREVWNDADWAASNESSRSAFAWSVKDEVQGMTIFEWFKSHPEKGQRFDKAMVGFSSATGGLASIDAYPWHTLAQDTTVCDVGGGFGAFSLPLSKAHPQLKITLQDMDGPLEHAKQYWRDENPTYLDAGRISFVPIDFFKDTAVQGQDIYYLRHVLHMWSDEQASLVLENVRKAMLPHSRLLVHDYVLQHACPITDSPQDSGLDVVCISLTLGLM